MAQSLAVSTWATATLAQFPKPASAVRLPPAASHPALLGPSPAHATEHGRELTPTACLPKPPAWAATSLSAAADHPFPPSHPIFGPGQPARIRQALPSPKYSGKPAGHPAPMAALPCTPVGARPLHAPPPVPHAAPCGLSDSSDDSVRDRAAMRIADGLEDTSMRRQVRYAHTGGGSADPQPPAASADATGASAAVDCPPAM